MNTLDYRAHAGLALWLTPGVGPACLARLERAFPQLCDVFGRSETALCQLGISQALAAAILDPPWAAVEATLAWAAEPGHHLIKLQHPAYPPLLKEIAQPPPFLFIQGHVDVLQSPQVALVGSRNPTPAGVSHARDFAAALAEGGVTVTSGLALGIDSAAHAATLEVGGVTIAVLGTGIDHVYPKRNRGLAARVCAQGALVSEFPLGTCAKREHFPRRNRVISGLSLGVLVIEAARRSGSLITARLAMEQNREVFALPGSIHNPLAQGCHYLIQQGAKLVQSVAEVLEELQMEDNCAKLAGPEKNVLVTLDRDQAKLVKSLGFETASIDSLVERTGWAVGELMSRLTELELKGLVHRVDGGYLRRI